MSDDTIETTEAGGTTRRNLLKGAVAAGVGAAVYTAPIVSSVPAYATHGLSTWTTQSDVLCFWFSPNHQSNFGDWHLPSDKVITNVFNPIVGGTNYGDHANTISSTTTRMEFRVPATAGGTWRELQVGGHPNNWGGTTADTFKVDGWNGGGMWLRLLDPNCEFLLIGLTDDKKAAVTASGCGTAAVLTGIGSSNSPIHSGNVNPGTNPGNTLPNPWQGDATQKRYYHTGKQRKGPVPGVRFRIRCK